MTKRRVFSALVLLGGVCALTACSGDDDGTSTGTDGTGGSATPGGAGGTGGSATPGGAGGTGGSDSVPPPGCEGVITFPDPALESAVRDAIQMPTGDILSEHVLQLSELHARGDPISGGGMIDLSGLQCLQGLTELYLSGNEISDLSPLSWSTALSMLDLGFNEISDLSPLSGLTALTELWLNANAISDLSPLSGLTALTELSLDWNDISDLSPLVANTGIGSSDTVVLVDNPIDCTAQAANIQTLQDRGVELHTDCP